MTDNELLLAISEMLDTKLDSELKPIKNDIHNMQGDIHSMQDDIHSMQGDICNMQGNIHSMQDDIRNIQGDMLSMQGDIHNIQGDMLSMQDDIHNIQGNMLSMQDDIQNMKLFQENIILPRLDTIESCYTETYKRYRDYTDKIEAVFEDVDLLKKVVSEHSEMLQKIS